MPRKESVAPRSLPSARVVVDDVEDHLEAGVVIGATMSRNEARPFVPR
jgi:hypothetical protein